MKYSLIELFKAIGVNVCQRKWKKRKLLLKMYLEGRRLTSASKVVVGFERLNA